LLRNQYGKRLDHDSGNEKIGTVHKFQGAQFEVILFSPVIHSSKNSSSFINRKPNLLNVAVSRAKQQFIVVGNYYQLVQAKGYLQTLAETVGSSFLVINETPGPEAKQAYKQCSLKLLRDCEHIEHYENLCRDAKQSLTIISPWIFSKANDWPHKYQPILEAVKRGVDVKVYYGWKNREYGTTYDDGDAQLIRELKQLLGKKLVRLKRGTHEKIIIQDNRILVIGSWNWLSHSYFNYCKKNKERESLLIRRETSVVIDDQEQLEALFAKTIR
jgi:superfamily I DNA and/or RNA helicase